MVVLRRRSGSSVGMPFYDAYTTSAFQAAYGRPMAVIASQNSSPQAYPDECAFLPGLIGDVYAGGDGVCAADRTPIRGSRCCIRRTSTTRALNQVINFPAAVWTPANLACLKTENFTYTGDRESEPGAAIDPAAAAAWISRVTKQPPGGHQRLHDAVGQGAQPGAGGRRGIGGAVRARSILPDWIWACRWRAGPRRSRFQGR